MKYWRWIRSIKGTVLWGLLGLIPLMTAMTGKTTPFVNSTLLMMVVMFFPCMVCCSYLIGGSFCMIAEIVLCLISMNMAFGTGGAVIGAILLVIPAVTFIYICGQDIPFHKSICIMMAVYGLINIGLFIWLRAWCNGDILGAAGKAVEDSFRNMTYNGKTGIGNEMVRMLAQIGYLGENVSDDIENVYSALRTMTEEMTQMLILSQVSNIIFSSVIAVGASQHFARRSGLRRGEKVDLPKNGMPPLRDWYIPRQWGAAIGIFAVGILMKLVFRYEENPAMNITGSVFFSIFEAFYMVQGIAVINCVQHRRGSGRFARLFVPLLMMAVLPIVATLLGIWDQWKDIRGLRGPKADKEENNDEGNFTA